MPTFPKWLPTVVASVALVGGSGVAAAALTSGSGGLDVTDEPTTVPIDPVPTTTAPVSDEPSADVPDPSGVDGSAGDTARYWGPECGDNPTNHGGYVSRADKNGGARSEAAHSPCGKPLASVTTTTTAAAPSDQSPNTGGSDAPAPAALTVPKPHGHGAGGGGHGRGHSGDHGH